MNTNPDRPNAPCDAILTQAKRLLPRVVIAWTLSVIAVVALAAGFMNFDDIGIIWTVPIEAVALVVVCTGVMDLIYAARWRLWLRIAEPAQTFGLLRLWTFVIWSRFGSQFLPIPAVSVAIRAGAVKAAAGVSTKRAVCSVAPDPVLDLYQFLLVVPITAALLTGHISTSQAAVGVCIALSLGAIFLVSLFPRLMRLAESARRLIHRSRRRSASTLRREPASEPPASACAEHQTPFDTSPAIMNVADTSLMAVDRRLILKAYGLTVLRYVFVGLRLWAIAIAVGLSQLTAPFFAATGTVTQAAHMATITPGALGALEGGWFVALRASGVSAHQATLFVTAQRILLWLALAIMTTALTLIYLALVRRTRCDTTKTIAPTKPETLPGVAAS